MQLRIKPYHKNTYPYRGILIKNSSVSVWLNEIERLEFDLNELEVYAIPDKVANSIWGCLVIDINDKPLINNPHPICQMVDNRLFIPTYATLFPSISNEELKRLFPGNRYVAHPDFGFVTLEEQVDWSTLINLKSSQEMSVSKPSRGVKLPNEVKSFMVKEVPPEDVLQDLEENVFPKKETLADEDLSKKEKIKLNLLKKLFNKSENEGEEKIEKSGLLKGISSVIKLLKGEDNWTEKLKIDYEELERRNQEQIDKLLSLFEENPDEALKYAIPLDENNSSRGTDHAQLDVSKKWSDFSLFGDNTNNRPAEGGSGIIPMEHFDTLRQQYHSTADKLIKNGDHKKAAFIYIKLLKNYSLAAQTMKNGEHYAEAAAIYLKYLENKSMAAQCYEQGNMTLQAIDIYKDMGSEEKVGDLYMKINQEEEAFKYYERVVESQLKNNDYLRTSILLQTKMNDYERSQSSLKTGWQKGFNSLNCLNKYLYNFKDEKLLDHEIQQLYDNDTTERNVETFLSALITEYKRKRSSSDKAREIAYEIISQRFEVNPNIGSQLKTFNEEDKILMKDVLRYKSKKGK